MEVSGKVVDLLEQQIAVGDRLAGAFRIGNVAVMRTGTVLGFSERGNKLTIRVQWERESFGSRQGGKDVDLIGNIEAGLTRFVKIA